MENGKVPPRNVEKKDKIVMLLNQRREFYGPVIVKSALVKERETWKNALTKIEILYKDQKSQLELSYNYGNFIISETSLNIDELISLVENLIMNRTLTIKNCPTVQVEGEFSYSSFLDYLSSGDDVFKLQWPADGFLFEASSNFKPNLSSGRLVSVGAPLFPSSHEAVRIWTVVDVSRSSYYNGAIVILLPNYKAKIEEIRLSPKLLTVKAIGRELNTADIMGKVYCEKLGQDVIQQDIYFEGSTVTIPLNFVPDHWYVCILSKETGEVLDFREIRAYWSSLPPGVVLELSPADIEEIIRRGESERVEFKQEINKKPKEFIETVVAFSNSAGGTIFIGVDDNGNITGTYEQKIEERITNLLREKCEPPIEPVVESKDIDEKRIFIVQVKEGKDKPYNFRGRGIFIRSGSTDRIASRIEIDRFYQEKQSLRP